jgi:hypothetical protein
MVERLIIHINQLEILSFILKTYKQAYQHIFIFYLKK